MELSSKWGSRFSRFSSREGAMTNKQMILDGIAMYPSRINGTKNTESNSSWISKVEYVPLNDFQGFVILTLKTDPQYLYKGEIKQGSSKGGTLTVPVAFKAFVMKLCSPNNKPFDGVGRKLWGMRTFEGAGEGQGGESEHQAEIVKSFKQQHRASGKSYEVMTNWIQEGKIAKLQRAINRGSMLNRRFSPEQLILMFLKTLRF